jgi:hypothetical protein
MGEYVMMAIVLGSVLFYGWFVFIWLTGWLANLLAAPFGKPTDDEVLRLEGTEATGGIVLEPVTRGDQRVRNIGLLLIWPVLFYLHYRFWQPLYTGVEWLFDSVIVPVIAALT